jgi:uncharacterized protein YutE (UPF0331/DUF86 family)
MSHKVQADTRNAGSAESCLRRARGKHLSTQAGTSLAKGFARGEVEYRAIAEALGELGVLSPQESALMRVLAGYRNRLVHFYHEVSAHELYEICYAAARRSCIDP